MHQNKKRQASYRSTLSGEEQKLHATVLLISVGARLARESGLRANHSLTDEPGPIVGAGLARDDGLTGDLSFLGGLAIKLNAKKKATSLGGFCSFS